MPTDLDAGDKKGAEYLSKLNLDLLERLQNSDEVYLSKAVIKGKFALRVSIVNFQTALADIEARLPVVVRMGKELDGTLRPEGFSASKP